MTCSRGLSGRMVDIMGYTGYFCSLVHTAHLFVCCLFMYTASVMFDYYCRDSELSSIGGIGFQSTPPLEGAGVFNMPESDSPQNTKPPFIA